MYLLGLAPHAKGAARALARIIRRTSSVWTDVDLSTLQQGDELFSRQLNISAGQAAAYRQAVEDDTPVYVEAGLVPAMAVAALVMAEAMQAITLPAGAVHTGQELTFAREVDEGTTLSCSATVASNGVRGGARFLALLIEASDDHGVVMSGRSSITIAEGER